MSLHPTFTDPQWEATFRRQGYVVLPFLEASHIAGILDTFHGLRPSDSYRGWQETALGRQSFHVTFFDPDPHYRQQVFALVRDIFQPFATKRLAHHRMVQGNVFIKPPRQGFVFPHQNLTITQEDHFRSISLWCPLQDTHHENGTLYVLPGSHHGFLRYRNTHILWPWIDAFMDHGPAEPYLVPLEVKAGEVVVLDDRIVHVSPQNHTDSPRWVLHALWLPETAPLRYYDVEGHPPRVAEYAVEEDFWQMHAPGTHPTGLRRVALHPYHEPHYTTEELIAVLKRL